MTEKRKKNPGGRPPKYKTAEELQNKIDEYFDKNPDKPTITGLVLFCDFCDRSSFYDLEKTDKFSHTIKKARSRMESCYEEMIHFAPNPAGAIFALKNFGWKDKVENDVDGQLTVKIVRE